MTIPFGRRAFLAAAAALAVSAPMVALAQAAPIVIKFGHIANGNDALRLKLDGGWVVGDAQCNGNHFGTGQAFNDGTAVPVGARCKF